VAESRYQFDSATQTRAISDEQTRRTGITQRAIAPHADCPSGSTLRHQPKDVGTPLATVLEYRPNHRFLVSTIDIDGN
jgi:hypothetical protein